MIVQHRRRLQIMPFEAVLMIITNYAGSGIQSNSNLEDTIMSKKVMFSLFLSIILMLTPLAGLASEEVSCSTDTTPAEPVEVIIWGPASVRPFVTTSDGRKINADIDPSKTRPNLTVFIILPHPETGLLPETITFEGGDYNLAADTTQSLLSKLYVGSIYPDFDAQKLVLKSVVSEGEVYQYVVDRNGGENVERACSVFGVQVHLAAFDQAYSTTEPVIELDFDASPLEQYYWGDGKLELTTEHRFTGEKVTIRIGLGEVYYPKEKIGLLQAYEEGRWQEFDFNGSMEPNF